MGPLCIGPATAWKRQDATQSNGAAHVGPVCPSSPLTPLPPPVYHLDSEVSPPQFRGHLVSFSEICINIGLMLGFVADAVLLPLPSGVNWRIMLGLGMVMPFILIILTCTGTS